MQRSRPDTDRPVKWLLASLICLLVLPSVDAGKKIRFKGKPVIRANSRLTLTPQKAYGMVAVLDELLGAFMVLPYSETWVFEASAQGALTGEDKRYRITLATWEKSEGTEKDYLTGLLDNLEASDKMELRNVEFLEINGETLVRYEARLKGLSKDLARLNPWLWNYWSAAGRADAWVDLHLSFRASVSGISPEDGRLQIMLGPGLKAELPEPGG